MDLDRFFEIGVFVQSPDSKITSLMTVEETPMPGRGVARACQGWKTRNTAMHPFVGGLAGMCSRLFLLRPWGSKSQINMGVCSEY